MTGADVLIALIVLGSTLLGLLRGFVREAVSLAFWIVAIWAAWKFGPSVEPHLGGLLADPKVAPWVGRLVVLMLVLLIGWLIGMMLSLLRAQRGPWPLGSGHRPAVRHRARHGADGLDGHRRRAVAPRTRKTGGVDRSWCPTVRPSAIG